MVVPSDYLPNYDAACAIDAELASNYIAHTLIGDPCADSLVASLSSYQPEVAAQFVRLAMNDPDDSALRCAPTILRDFFRSIEAPPDWVDQSEFKPGIRMFSSQFKTHCSWYGWWLTDRGIYHQY